MDIYNIINIVPSLTLHFDFIEIVGKGTSANVWSVKNHVNRLFACKILLEEGEIGDILEEASIMSKISKHPNIGPFLTFYGLYSHENKPAIIMELFEGWELINLKIKLDQQQLLYLAKELYKQVAYLNNLNICHGDIHVKNILYNAIRVVLIDIINLKSSSDLIRGNAELAMTTVEYWNKGIVLGYNGDKLMWKKDIFDLGNLLRWLILGDYIHDWKVYIEDSNKYKIKTEYPIMDAIVNSSIEIDITLRPSAIDMVNYINQHS